MTKEEEIILVRAREKFMKGGFHKTTMDEIASDLRISKKTIYKYFPSKENLISAAIALFQKYILGQITKIIESNDDAVLKIFKIFEFIGRMMEKLDEKALADLKSRRPEVWEQIDDFRTNLIQENFAKIIDQGKSEGLIKNYPTEIIIAIYTAAIRSVINPDFVMYNKLTLDEAKNLTIDIIMSAILTEKGKEIYNKYTTGN
ncbi:TetR/AcrR family transcriptional regulator [Bacteroidota bacterium]